MKRENLVSYRKKVANDLMMVDNAISDGIYLSKEEWFDFIFKSAMIGYRSWNIVKYSCFNKSLCHFAEVYAEAFTYLLSISIDGFNNDDYISCIKHIVSGLNKFCKDRSKRFKVNGFDKNGSLFIKVSHGNSKGEVYKIKGISCAIEKLIFIVRSCISNIDIFSHTGDFGKFLIGYISNEFDKLESNVTPTPYICASSKYSLRGYVGATSGIIYNSSVKGKVISI